MDGAFFLTFSRKYGILERMKLTNGQVEIGMVIREVAPPPDNDPFGDYVDLTRAVACMVDGAQKLVNPRVMQQRFQAAWTACAKLWMAENNRILKDCLGDSFDTVCAHPNGRDAFGRILKRVKETHGELSPGMTVNVEVDDILEELNIS